MTPQNCELKWIDSTDVWEAAFQHRCQDTCQIWKQVVNYDDYLFLKIYPYGSLKRAPDSADYVSEQGANLSMSFESMPCTKVPGKIRRQADLNSTLPFEIGGA